MIGPIKWDRQRRFGLQVVRLDKRNPSGYDPVLKMWNRCRDHIQRGYVKVWYNDPKQGPLVIDRALTAKRARAIIRDKQAQGPLFI